MGRLLLWRRWRRISNERREGGLLGYGCGRVWERTVVGALNMPGCGSEKAEGEVVVVVLEANEGRVRGTRGLMKRAGGTHLFFASDI